MDIDRRTLLKGGAGAGAAGLFGSEFLGSAAADISRSADWGEQEPPEAYDDYETHRVAQDGTGDFETIQAAVDAASERDLVLVEPGVYYEEVEINDTDRLTVRGTDRERVVLDGEFERYNGIVATTDGVVVENLTVRNYKGNGVYWLSTDVSSPVRGYRGSYITAHHIGVYAIYARNAEQGRFEHCYVSGCKDAGYYIGESQPARAVITDCLAEYNAMGYSGTNAGGGLVIEDSTWRYNMCGIVPNTLDSQAGAPQGHLEGGIRVENNYIHDNNRLDVPAIANAYAVYGTGVAIAGGQENDICGNTIENQEKYGVVVFPMITDTDPGTLPLRLFRAYAPLLSDDHVYPPKYNAVEDNDISGSGRVDMALAAPAEGNTFDANSAGSTRPMMLERRDDSFGDVMVFLQILRDFSQTEVGDYPSGTTREQPDPDFETLPEEFDSYEMDDPEATPARTPVGSGSYPDAEGET